MIDDNMFQERVSQQLASEVPEDVEVIIEEGPEPLTFLRLLKYPLSRSGLTVLCFFAVVPFLLHVALILLSGILPLLAFALLLIVWIAEALIALSTFWYLTICICASAEGQVKAPDVFEYSQDDTLLDWIWQFLRIVFTVSICIAPAFLITYFAHLSRPAFWGILAAGIFFLPMLLLAVVMFDTINALNPILIIASIFSTFFSYLGIVVQFCVPLLLLIGMNIASLKSHDPLLSLLVDAVGLYLMMIAACLLGRFFHNNEEKLRWDV